MKIYIDIFSPLMFIYIRRTSFPLSVLFYFSQNILGGDAENYGGAVVECYLAEWHRAASGSRMFHFHQPSPPSTEQWNKWNSLQAGLVRDTSVQGPYAVCCALFALVFTGTDGMVLYSSSQKRRHVMSADCYQHAVRYKNIT